MHFSFINQTNKIKIKILDNSLYKLYNQIGKKIIDIKINIINK